MKRFIILPNLSKDEDLKTTRLIIDWLERHNRQVYLPIDVAKQLGRASIGLEQDALFANADLAIVLGGDGTILYTARLMAASDVPILGVNLGNLGFLAEVEKKDAILTLKKIIDGDYYIQKRMMLNVKKVTEEKEETVGVALNDIVIARASISRMMKYSIFVNDGHVNHYSADGLIVSTPTGSTAYNLSAGGPILAPANEMMVITPICPHTLMSRSIVLSQNDEVRISLRDNRKSWNKDIMLTIDGQENYKIGQEADIIVSKSEHSAKLITCNKNGFYRILKKKLGNR